MDADQKKIDETVQGVVKSYHDFLIFKVRDETGAIPLKVRTTVFTKRESGEMHMTEIETKIEAEKYEESYQEWLEKDVVRRAKEIIEDEKG